MVLQRGSNGLETCIERFCNVDRMVLLHGLNALATHIEWFCNTDRTVWQHTMNTFAIHHFSVPEKLKCVHCPVGYGHDLLTSSYYKRFTLALPNCCTLTSTADFCLFARHIANCSTGLPKVFIKVYQSIRTHKLT